jgi:hypothetical protein
LFKAYLRSLRHVTNLLVPAAWHATATAMIPRRHPRAIKSAAVARLDWAPWT